MRYLLIFILSFLSLKSAAQDLNVKENYILAVLPALANDAKAQQYSSTITAKVDAVFVGKSRFTVVERTNFDKILQEKKLQKEEDFIDGVIAEQGVSLGAQYLVFLNVTLLTSGLVMKESTKSVKNPSTGKFEQQTGKTQFAESTLNARLNIVEVATKRIISTKELSSSVSVEGATETQAINMAINRLDSQIKSWSNDVFPVYMKVVKLEEPDKKGIPTIALVKGAKELYIREKEILNPFAKSSFEIYETYEEEIDGEVYTRTTAIGKLVLKPGPDELVPAKILKDGDTILKRFNEGATLLVRMVKY